MTEKEHKGLPSTAYEMIPGDQYEPYVPDKTDLQEVSFLAVILGILQGIIFGMAMVYVGLKVGMTISASIPAAVISMGIMKGLFHKGNILETNLAKTIASAGESMAAGIIFTLPAVYLWPEFKGEIAASFPLWKMALIAAIGGSLGVLLMIPLRRFLIVQEHGKLKYPEGTACAEVLVAGEVGGNPAKLVFSGIGVGAVYKFLQDSLKLWMDQVTFQIPFVRNMEFSAENSPILLSVGYIIGLQVSSYMLSGGLLAWFVLIPMISYFGESITTAVAPGLIPISQMTASEVWSSYIRYIGAGAVAMGGIISLSKSLPTIITSFKVAFREFVSDVKASKDGGDKIEKKRTNDDLPIGQVLVASLILIVLIALTGTISNNFIKATVGAVMVFVFGFFFVTVSARIVGLVGTSSNPVSGMTIGTLILSTVIFKFIGLEGIDGMVTSLMVGTFVCIAMALAGDISQDLKTGFLVGGTPRWMQLGEIVGVCAAAFFVVWTAHFLAPQIQSGEFPAPQANLMAIIIRGIMESQLPWVLVITGAFVAVCIELLGIPALPVAVGLYLPLSLSTPIMVGGILSWLTVRLFKDEEYKKRNENGILSASGLIAGDALMGLVVVAIAARMGSDGMAMYWAGSWWRSLSIVVFALISAYLWYNVIKKAPEDEMAASCCGGGENISPSPADTQSKDSAESAGEDTRRSEDMEENKNNKEE